MPVVRVSHNFGDWPLLRQTPGGRGEWGGFTFVLGDDPRAGAPDYWLVVGGLAAPEQAEVARDCVCFFTAEPEAVHRYSAAFLAQFGTVVTSQAAIAGRRVVHTQPSLPWHIGVRRRRDEGGVALDHDAASRGYDELGADAPQKTRALSVICSAKADLPGQRRRLELVQELKRRLGDRLDWFGRGIAPVEDKWEAIAPYRFHISLENAQERDYWTEKLADAYLGDAFPLYGGCPNLGDYFPSDAFTLLPLDDVREAVSVIETALDRGLTADNRRALADAKRMVLDEYNVFAAAARIFGRRRPARRTRVELHPEAGIAEARGGVARRVRALRSGVGVR